MKSLMLYFVVLVLVGFALLTRFKGTNHSTTDDYLAGGALLLAVALAVPAQVKEAINAIRPIVPWAKRLSGSQSAVNGDKP